MSGLMKRKGERETNRCPFQFIDADAEKQKSAFLRILILFSNHNILV